MADIICIIGNKGGTGKTTLSHMLCQGMGLLGQRSVCVLTDTYREPLNPEGRRYLVADARTREALIKVTDKIRSLDAWMGVIDGGGNRTEMDRKLYTLADLVLLPFRDSHEDIRTLIRDLEMFPRAYAIPTQWPVIPWQRDTADRTMEDLLAPYSDRILMPVNAFNATKLLLKSEIGNDIPPQLAEACSNVARQVLDLLQIPVQVAEQMPRIARPVGATRRNSATGTLAATGHGLMSEGKTPPDPFEAIKTLWGSMGFAMPGMVTPTFDTGELEKRISDLKAVEGWLQMNLGMLQTTIQGLEMQRQTLAAMQASMPANSQPKQDKE